MWRVRPLMGQKEERTSADHFVGWTSAGAGRLCPKHGLCTQNKLRTTIQRAAARSKSPVTHQPAGLPGSERHSLGLVAALGYGGCQSIEAQDTAAWSLLEKYSLIQWDKADKQVYLHAETQLMVSDLAPVLGPIVLRDSCLLVVHLTKLMRRSSS